MLAYTISPLCTDPTGAALYLSVNKQTQDIVVWTKLPNNDPSQLWIPLQYVNNNGAQGVVLLNAMTNKIIAAPNDAAAVTQIPLDLQQMEENRCSWNILDARTGPATHWGAVQLNKNQKMNLNVEGGGPYPNGTRVLVWGWSVLPGANNQSWTFAPVLNNA
ncbi:MAG: hypothetical protein SF097_13885 [Acidobacteriota bacterium]|nr:hypothetical protein [Acidobacteriota bacterium]